MTRPYRVLLSLGLLALGLGPPLAGQTTQPPLPPELPPPPPPPDTVPEPPPNTEPQPLPRAPTTYHFAKRLIGGATPLLEIAVDSPADWTARFETSTDLLQWTLHTSATDTPNTALIALPADGPLYVRYGYRYTPGS
ncbi:MAG: hypothetical protein ACOC3I_07945 [Verrucomicrobiota bacterium]